MIQINHFFLIFSVFVNLFELLSSKPIFDYSHNENSPLSIQVGSLKSIAGVLPFKFYDLGLCVPENLIKEEDNLGEILTGQQYYNTKYEIFTNKNEYCKILCTAEITNEKMNKISKVLMKNYKGSFFLDRLPAGIINYNPVTQSSSIDYFSGVPLGYIKENEPNGIKEIYLYNHFQLHIILNNQIPKQYEIVGFNILPLSILHESEKNLKCSKNSSDITSNILSDKYLLKEGPVIFTYDVIFEYSNITMASRWDHYKPSNKNIHWAGIVSSNLIIAIFTSFIIIIFCRGIRRDVENYNSRVTNEDFLDEYGWKQVCNDVFRSPQRNKMLLSSIIGTGIQLFCMLFATLLLSVLGFLNPDRRSNLLTLGLLFFVFMGIPGGYASAKFYRLFGGNDWLKNSILTAFFFPGFLFTGYSFVNILLSIEGSSASVNFLDIFSFLILWLCCSSPLVLIGSFFGIKSKIMSIPCKVNAVPTTIPEKKWYFHLRFTFWIAGILSFSTIFIELVYVMASLWRHQIYFLATFLWISFLVLIIVSIEITIILTYVNLCYGDYVWWWKSFALGGSSGIYIIIYTIYYFFNLKITRLSAMIVYFGIMGMISVIVFLVCGGISTIATFFVLRQIYSMIKVD